MEYPTFKYKHKVNPQIHKLILKRAAEKTDPSLNILLEYVKRLNQDEEFEEIEFYANKIIQHKECTANQLYELSKVYVSTRTHEKALMCLTKITDPSWNILALKAKVLNYLNRKEEAIKIIYTILQQSPHNQKALEFLTSHYFDKREFDDSINISSKILKKNPKNIRAIATLINAHYSNQTLDLIHPLVDYPSIVKTYDLKPSAAPLSNITLFNPALNEEISKLDTWIDNPHKTTTMNGSQVDLTQHQSPLFLELKLLFQKKIIAYLKESISFEFSYFNQIPSTITLNIISSVRLKNGGFQESHIHPNGWLSGVYYTAVPQFPVDSEEGNLEFGVMANNLFKPLHAIRPKEGMLVLFPSYLRHRTIPFSSQKDRICISFDVIGLN